MAAASPLPHFFQHLSRERDVFLLGNEEGGVVAPLAGSFAAVAVVDENFRSWLFV